MQSLQEQAGFSIGRNSILAEKRLRQGGDSRNLFAVRQRYYSAV